MSVAIDTKLVGPQKEFQGRRLFIVGSGPSLDDLDLSILDGQNVWALNASATLFADRPGLFWLFRDTRTVGQVLPRLKSWRQLRVLTTVRGFSDLECQTKRSRRAYIYDHQSVVHHRTVAEDALQLARRAGATDAVLVGVDCSAPAGVPYAKALMWKPCAWYDVKKPVAESKACASMLKALRDLAPSLHGFPVYSTSRSCDAFPYIELAHAVEGRTAPAV